MGAHSRKEGLEKESPGGQLSNILSSNSDECGTAERKWLIWATFGRMKLSERKGLVTNWRLKERIMMTKAIFPKVCMGAH